MTLYYTSSHEWLSVQGDTATIGITDYAQSQLGDVVFVELPAVGATFAQQAEAAVVESVKAASEIYMPASGEVLAVNDTLTDEPSLVNQSAEVDGWFFKCRLTALAELDGLMTADAYAAHIATEAQAEEA